MSLNVSEYNVNTKSANFSSKQAGDLENECQIFVMKLEREKINYRLCEERYQKHLNTYNALTGKESSNKKEDGSKTLSNKEKFNKKMNDGKETNNMKNTEKIERDHDIHTNESEKVNKIEQN
jgi:hypothetical protein